MFGPLPSRLRQFPPLSKHLTKEPASIQWALHDHHYHSSCIVTGLPASPKRNRANFSLQSGNTGPQVRKRCQQKAPKETTKCQAVTVNHTDTHTHGTYWQLQICPRRFRRDSDVVPVGSPGNHFSYPSAGDVFRSSAVAPWKSCVNYFIKLLQ